MLLQVSPLKLHRYMALNLTNPSFISKRSPQVQFWNSTDSIRLRYQEYGNTYLMDFGDGKLYHTGYHIGVDSNVIQYNYTGTRNLNTIYGGYYNNSATYIHSYYPDENQLSGSIWIASGIQNATIYAGFNTGVTGITLPTGLVNTPYLNLDNSRYTGILILPQTGPNLQTLNLSYNLNLTGVDLPTGYYSINYLALWNNQFRNIIIPSTYEHLNNIDFSNNKVTGFTFLNPSTGLKSLGIQSNSLTGTLDLSPNWTKLNFLSCGSNNYTGINIPTGLTKLVNFSCGINKINTTINLPAAPELYTIDLSNNALTGFVIPSACTGIWSFSLSLNAVPCRLYFSAGSNITENINLWYAKITGEFLLPSSHSGATTIEIRSNNYTGITLPTGTRELRALYLPNPKVNGLRNNLLYTYIDLSDCNLSTTTVDDVMDQTLYSIRRSNRIGSLLLSGTGPYNKSPSSSGSGVRTTLRASGWTVTTM